MSSTSFFIARRIYQSDRRVSRPASLISVTGITVGLAVMFISIAVIIGFKSEVRNKITGFASHIQVTDINVASHYNQDPLYISDSLLYTLAGNQAIAKIQRYSVKPGMIKTQDAFQGIMLKGVGPEYDTTFFHRHMLEGRLPAFSDTVASNSVVISKSMADKLKLKVGDKIDTYFIQGNIRIRRLYVAGIYQTNLTEYDNLYLLTDLFLVNRLNNWNKSQASGLELELVDDSNLDETTWLLANRLGKQYCVRNMKQLNPQIFSWLNILDMNIWVILALMTGVAGFTIIAGLLIIIIEHTAMIGILKSLGAPSKLIRHIFLWLSVFLVGRGMVWGNVIGIAFYLIQRTSGILRLNPENYYMDTVPVSFSLPAFLFLNIGTLIISVLMLIGPSYLIAHIKPTTAMRYE